MPRVAGLDLGHLFGRARNNDLTTAIAALGADIDDPVRSFDDVEVVLDDDHRVALLHQFVEHLEELPDILEMEARGGLIKDVKRPPRGPLRELTF